MRGLSLVLIPIYTTHLAPAEFGLVELLTVVIDFASLLIGGRLGIALFKYYHDATSEEQKRKVVSTALVSASLANLAAIVLIAILSRGAAEWSSVPEGFDTALRVLSITLVLNAFNEVFFSYLRLKERPKAYVTANILRFVGQLLLNILFIVYLGFGYSEIHPGRSDQQRHPCAAVRLLAAAAHRNHVQPGICDQPVPLFIPPRHLSFGPLLRHAR